MDGFTTYVLNYQDAAGNVFTARTITNNPEFPSNGRAILEQIYRALGYDLISADKIEEVASTMEIRAPGLSLSAKLYRGMIIAAVALTLGNIAWDAYTFSKLATAKEKSAQDRAEIMQQLENQERLLTRIEGRQQHFEAELDRLEAHRRQ